MTHFYTYGQTWALAALGINKYAATAIMKELTPAAKSFMQRLTEFSGRAEVPQVTGARRLRQALTRPGTPELMTEMHLEPGLSASEQAAKSQAKQHYERVLGEQGKMYSTSADTASLRRPTVLSSMSASNPVTSITRADLPSWHLGRAQTVAAPRVSY